MTSSANPAASRLSFMTKFIYGLGDWGNTTTATIFGFFFAFFLNNVAGLQPIYAAPVLLAGGIWDAVNDPLIGSLADRVRTRWGRRRPFFLLGAIPFAISFILLWWVPPFDTQLGKAIYYALAYIFFDTMFTIVSVPYAALTPELTDDYDERTRLNGFRAGVSMVGGLIAAVAVPVVVDAFVNKRDGYMLVAIIFGVLAAVPYFLLFFQIKERFSAVAHQMDIFKGFLITWKNRAFRYASGIYLTSWATISLAGALFQYYVTFWLRMPDKVDIVLGLMMLSTTLFIPVMVVLTNRLNKKRAYILATGFWVVVMLAISFLPQDAGTAVFFLAAAAGVGIASAPGCDRIR
jgi:GPH family glycoside/pentoside/hexuronide:cation symporter